MRCAELARVREPDLPIWVMEAVRIRALLLWALAVVLVGCIVAPHPGDPSPGREVSSTAPAPGSFNDVARRLAGHGLAFLRRLPRRPERYLTSGEIRPRLDRLFGGDFEVLSVNAGLVDVPDDHFNWSGRPVYVAERVGRGSHCFIFLHAVTGERLLDACGFGV